MGRQCASKQAMMNQNYFRRIIQIGMTIEHFRIFVFQNKFEKHGTRQKQFVIDLVLLKQFGVEPRFENIACSVLTTETGFLTTGLFFKG